MMSVTGSQLALPPFYATLPLTAAQIVVVGFPFYVSIRDTLAIQGTYNGSMQPKAAELEEETVRLWPSVFFCLGSSVVELLWLLQLIS